MEERPALAEQVKPRVDELQRQWDELENVTREKGENMLEANRGKFNSFKTILRDTWSALDLFASQIRYKVLCVFY